MRYLITGGSGFIGSNFIEELVKVNGEILNVDIKAPNIASHMPFWRQQDILDFPGLLAVFREFQPTHVIHLAARTDTYGTSIDEYEVNTTGSKNLLDAIKKTASVQRALITSTQFVNQYNGKPRDDLDFAPHTIYGESKVITEQLTRAAELDCVWTIIRPTNIWGPWHLRYPHEFWRILGKGLYFHPGGGRVMRSYGYVKNVVWQMMQMCNAPAETVGGHVFYVGDEPIDLLDWVNGFSMRQIGREVIVVPGPLIKVLALLGDFLKHVGVQFPITSSRFKSMTTSNDAPMDLTFQTFGRPPYSLQAGVDETVAWLRKEHPSLVKIKVAS